MRRFASSKALSLLLLLAAPACTSSDAEDSTGDESDLRVKPKDGETLAQLVVTTPPGWTLSTNPADDGSATYRGAGVTTDLKLNTPARLNANATPTPITFSGKFDYPFTATNVTLTKGKTTTLALGSLKPTYVPASDPTSTLWRDFGPRPHLTVGFTAPGATAEVAVIGGLTFPAFWAGAPQKALLAPPGAYRFSWNLPILDDVKRTLGDGENATVSLAPPDRRATIIVKKPASRELPDVTFPGSWCHAPTSTFLVQRNADNSSLTLGEPTSWDQNAAVRSLPAKPILEGGTQYSAAEKIASWAALAMKDDTTVKVFPFAASEGTAHYELVVNGVPTIVDLKPGDTKTFQLERLDVDDVEVTKEDGSTYTVRGTWKLFRQGPNNSWIPVTHRTDCSTGPGAQVAFSTNAGLDVLPGTYRLVFSYTTAEGAKTQEQIVTVP